ncbi:MAG: ketol-acid reductoisomerase [Candidatus Latescibacteria bacterium 4484_7]|nr:MAG: ketol-acid reductoisomerase [Candidatus Latescibacteria bacterium 4484_7]RKZ07121.1 MAG: ketol-acid reductoisomerase [bacterium]
MDLIDEKSVDREFLRTKSIVVMGYGNQGRPQALNLRDSGLDVKIAAREGGKGFRKALDDGFEVVGMEEGIGMADVLMFLLPDEVHREVFEAFVDGRLRSGSAVVFAHGFSVAFDEVSSDRYDMILVAPKGQGAKLRERYIEGSGLPALIGVENDASGQAWKTAAAIAWGIGCLRVGAYRTTFREEAVSDLFGEQAVLCGGVPALVKGAFDVLVERGFSPETAYFECLYELKIIVDLFYERGFSGMRDVISGTAAYGSLKFGEGIIDEHVIDSMRRLLDRIESGEFSRNWLMESAEGAPELKELKSTEKRLLIEKVGAKIRGRLRRNGTVGRKDEKR